MWHNDPSLTSCRSSHDPESVDGRDRRRPGWRFTISIACGRKSREIRREEQTRRPFSHSDCSGAVVGFGDSDPGAPVRALAFCFPNVS